MMAEKGWIYINSRDVTGQLSVQPGQKVSVDMEVPLPEGDTHWVGLKPGFNYPEFEAKVRVAVQILNTEDKPMWGHTYRSGDPVTGIQVLPAPFHCNPMRVRFNMWNFGTEPTHIQGSLFAYSAGDKHVAH